MIVRAWPRLRLVFSLSLLMLLVSPREGLAATQIQCNQADNTKLLCRGDPCTVSQDFAAPTGCVLDFGAREVIFKGAFDVASAVLAVSARSVRVDGVLRASPGNNLRGGTITLTATGGSQISDARVCGLGNPDGCIVVTRRIEVSGNPAGAMRLIAAGAVDLQSTADLLAIGFQEGVVNGASGGLISISAQGGALNDSAQLSVKGGNAGDGGTVAFLAAANIVVAQAIDATGGANDGGAVDLVAGDDISIQRTIDVSSTTGGGGGLIGARAGVDTLGGIKNGGALTLSSALVADGNNDIDSGYDGGDIDLAAFGPLTITTTASVHANGGSPDGAGGTLTLDSSDRQFNRLTALDGDLVLAGSVTLRGVGIESDGGETDITAGRNLTISGTVDATGANGGTIGARSGKDLTVATALFAGATTIQGVGGSAFLKAGDADFGTLNIAASIDTSSGTSSIGDDQDLAGCNLEVQPNVVINSSGGTLRTGRLDLAAPGTMTLHNNSRYLVTPSGTITLIHRPGVAPVIGSGVVFSPGGPIDAPTTNSPLYPSCPVCGDGIRQAGEVCDNGAGADGACCNATCSALTCPTPTSTTVPPTPTPTRTGTATRTPTPTATVSGPGTSVTPTSTSSDVLATLTPIATVTPRPTATVTATRTPTPTRTATPTVTPTVILPLVQPAPVTGCARAFGQATSAFALADLTALESCGLAVYKCVQSQLPAVKRDACLAKARERCTKNMDKLERARAQFAESLSSACGGVPFLFVRNASVLNFASLDDTCQNEFGLAVDQDLGALQACVQFGSSCRTEQALGVGMPRIADLLAGAMIDIGSLEICVPPASGNDEGLDSAEGAVALRCQKSVSAGGRGLLKQQIGTARQCIDGLLRCRLTGRSRPTCQKVATRCGARLARLTSARAKLAATVQRVCGALTPEALRGPRGLGFDQIAPRCADLSVAPASDATAIGTCVARAYTCAGNALLRHALPFADGELASFGLKLDSDTFCAPPGLPTPTVTPTPTHTVTPSFTGTVTPSLTSAVTPTVTVTPTPSGAPTASPTPSPSATVTIREPTATPTPVSPGCGDRVPDRGEQCDDGNTLDGDGCDHACMFELLVPGGGTAASDCLTEWAVINPHNEPALDGSGLPNLHQACVDGDPSCDADASVNDECRFRVAVCFHVADPNLPECTATAALARYKLLLPRPGPTPSRNPIGTANGAAIIQAFEHLSDTPPIGRSGNVFNFEPPLAALPPDNCSALAEIVVPLNGQVTQDQTLRGATATVPQEQSSAVRDRDTLRLICVRP